MTLPSAPARPCPNCGTGNPPYATFCHECGEPLAVSVASAPAADQDRGRRWEVWLGLALVVGVLGFALFDWAQREIQARQYHAGEEAVAARHWDAAQAAFAALGTYRDAPTRRAAAAAQIAARNGAYQAGLVAADPIVAALAFSRTLAIEPDYRQAPARYAAAAHEVPHAALAETVYRRVSGGTPGLYLYRAAGGDVRLPGSDERSLLRSFAGADGPLVYDGPIPGVTPYPVPSDDSPDAYNIPPLAADRQLLLADGAALRAGASVPPLPLPAALGMGGQLLANDQVVWSPAGFTPPPRFQLGFVHGSTLDKSYAYDVPREEGHDLSYPGASAYVLLDLNGVNHQRLWLLGGYSGAQFRPYQTTLYLLGADGARLQPVAVVPGMVYDAHLSANGQYLLYTVSAADGNQPDLPLDLVLRYLPDSTHTGQVLASVSGGAEDTRAALQGQFVPGDGPPRILIRRVLPDARSGNQVQLDLWSLADGAGRIIWRGPPSDGTGYTAEIYWLAPDGTSLLIPQPLGNGTVQLIWQAFDQSRSMQRVPLPDDGVPDVPVESWKPVFPGTMLPGDYGFYYFVNRYDSQANAADTLIYGVPARDPAPPPVLLYTRRAGADPFASISLLPSRLLLVQRADHTLELRTPDGSLQLPALPGVDLITPIPSRPLDSLMLYPWSY